jgi:hypothetical protein
MKLNWKKDNPNLAHKGREAKLTDGSSLVLYFIDRRNGWCLYREDAEGNQVGDSECAAYKAELLESAREIAESIKPKPLPIRPAYMGAVSEAQLETRRKAGMLSFMRKRDQQEDWS